MELEQHRGDFSTAHRLFMSSTCFLTIFSYVDYLHAARMRLCCIDSRNHKTFSNHEDKGSVALDNICQRQLLELPLDSRPLRRVYELLPKVYDYKLSVELTFEVFTNFAITFDCLKSPLLNRRLVVDTLTMMAPTRDELPSEEDLKGILSSPTGFLDCRRIVVDNKN